MGASGPRLTIGTAGAGAECRLVWTGGCRQDIVKLGMIGVV